MGWKRQLSNGQKCPFNRRSEPKKESGSPHKKPKQQKHKQATEQQAKEMDAKKAKANSAVPVVERDAFLATETQR